MNSRLVYFSMIICMIACIGDIILTTIAGFYYPGYSHLSNTLSQLGSNISPVSQLMSIWWIILGSMFVVLGFGFWKSFITPNRYVKIAFWLFAGYGVGEGICSGLFPVNYSNESFDFISLLHIVLSGVGVLSIMILPLVLRKIFIKESFPMFYRYSLIVLFFGLLFIGLFSLSKSIDDPQNYIVQLKGLWQRILSVNFYLYLVLLVFMMRKAMHVNYSVFK